MKLTALRQRSSDHTFPDVSPMVSQHTSACCLNSRSCCISCTASEAKRWTVQKHSPSASDLMRIYVGLVYIVLILEIFYAFCFAAPDFAETDE